MKNKRAFTLVEILVIIGIIALLGVLLFPVFFQARKQSQKATCQSNLRQVYFALHQYIDDYGTWPTNHLWDDRAFTSVKLNGCPQTAPASRPTASLGIRGYAYSTGLEGTVGGQTVALAESFILYPSTTVAVCEQSVQISTSYGPDPFHNTTQAPGEGEEKGWLRHNGGANYLFADGHVKWYLPDAVGYNETPNKDAGVRPTFALSQTATP